MTFQKDLREFIELLNALEVRFLIVGRSGVLIRRAKDDKLPANARPRFKATES